MAELFKRFSLRSDQYEQLGNDVDTVDASAARVC